MRNMVHLAVVAASILGLATHVQAGFFAGSTDFEGDNPLADALWENVGEAEIVADASIASAPRASNLPPSFDETIRTNVLSVDFGAGDSTFDTTETEGAVTQSVTATFSPTDVTAKFFKAVIEFPISEEPDEPEPDPEPDPEQE